VRKNFPKSPKVPESLYKIGLCFEKLGLAKDAKLFYEAVVQKYRRSDAAKNAKERLSKLK